MHSPHRGYTLTDTAGLLACLVLLLGLSHSLLLAATRAHPSDGVPMRASADGQRIKEIHQASLVYANSNREVLPRPGLIRRQPMEVRGQMQRMVGMGPADPEMDTTAYLYSALIAQNYFSPELLVSPFEPNQRVAVHRNYNYNAYRPSDAEYWDRTFTADLAGGSNTSYAHLVPFGNRMRIKWRSTSDPNNPLFSNRGPRDGEGDPTSYTCDDDGRWAGSVVFGDNSVRWLYNSMTPKGVVYHGQSGSSGEDNIFRLDDGWPGIDAILSFTLENGGSEPVIQHD